MNVGDSVIVAPAIIGPPRQYGTLNGILSVFENLVGTGTTMYVKAVGTSQSPYAQFGTLFDVAVDYVQGSANDQTPNLWFWTYQRLLTPYSIDSGGTPPPPPGVPGLKVNLSFLLPYVTLLLAIPVIGDWLAGIGDGAIIAFDALPGPLQDAIIAFAALVGTTIVKGVGTVLVNDVVGWATHLGKSGTPTGTVPAGFVKAWSANGVQFYRNGRRLGVLNKKGRFRTWVPKKPIVLYSDGTKNLKTLVKAVKAIKKELNTVQTQIIKVESPRARKPREPKYTLREVEELKRLHA